VLRRYKDRHLVELAHLANKSVLNVQLNIDLPWPKKARNDRSRCGNGAT
jgi:hypothetical protein